MTTDRPFGAQPASRSTADLVRHGTEQVSRLIRAEFALARAQASIKAKDAAAGAGLLAAAAVVALYGVGALLVAGVLLLVNVLPAWAAALSVAAVLLAVAAVLALSGRREVRRAGSPVPHRTVASVEEDIRIMSVAVHGRNY
jgi:hypothetical protein